MKDEWVINGRGVMITETKGMEMVVVMVAMTVIRDGVRLLIAHKDLMTTMTIVTEAADQAIAVPVSMDLRGLVVHQVKEMVIHPGAELHEVTAVATASGVVLKTMVTAELREEEVHRAWVVHLSLAVVVPRNLAMVARHNGLQGPIPVTAEAPTGVVQPQAGRVPRVLLVAQDPEERKRVLPELNHVKQQRCVH